MLKILEKIGNKRPIHIITPSSNQYPNYKTSNEYKPINKYKGSVVIFDDMLGAKNKSQIDEFFTRGRHENIDVYYFSQNYFALPRQSIRNNSDRIILFKQTLRDVQSMYYDIGAYDMIYDEFKEMCWVAWSEKFNYLCIDMCKKMKVNIVFSMKVYPHILNVFVKLKLFKCKYTHTYTYKYKNNYNFLCIRIHVIILFWSITITNKVNYSYKCHNYIWTAVIIQYQFLYLNSIHTSIIIFILLFIFG